MARARAMAAPPAAKKAWPVGRPIAALSVGDALALALALVDVAFAIPLTLALTEAEAEAVGVTEAAVAATVIATEVTG